jgi:hypothetical protein
MKPFAANLLAPGFLEWLGVFQSSYPQRTGAPGTFFATLKPMMNLF